MSTQITVKGSNVTVEKESMIAQLEHCADIARIRIDKTKASSDCMRVTAFFVPNDLAEEFELLIMTAKEELLKKELERLEAQGKRFAEVALKAPEPVQEGLKW